MHELSICRAIAGIVDRSAAGRPVEVVRVQVGQLRQIVPETLVYCWSLINEGTAYAGTQLEVDSVPASIRCESCGAVTVLDEPVLLCSTCASPSVVIETGEEFLVTSLDLQDR